MTPEFPTPDVVGVVITNGTQSTLVQPTEDGDLTMNGMRSLARVLAKRNPTYHVAIVRFTASEVIE